MAALNDMTDPEERPVSVCSVRVQGLTLDCEDASRMAGGALGVALEAFQRSSNDDARAQEAVWQAYVCAGEWLASCVRLCVDLGASREQLVAWTGWDVAALTDLLVCWPCVPGTFGPGSEG